MGVYVGTTEVHRGTTRSFTTRDKFELIRRLTQINEVGEKRNWSKKLILCSGAVDLKIFEKNCMCTVYLKKLNPVRKIKFFISGWDEIIWCTSNLVWIGDNFPSFCF